MNKFQRRKYIWGTEKNTFSQNQREGFWWKKVRRNDSVGGNRRWQISHKHTSQGPLFIYVGTKGNGLWTKKSKEVLTWTKTGYPVFLRSVDSWKTLTKRRDYFSLMGQLLQGKQSGERETKDGNLYKKLLYYGSRLKSGTPRLRFS